MSGSYIGEHVMVVLPAGDALGIVTRVTPDDDGGETVNVTVFPDGEPPWMDPGVRVLESRDAALSSLQAQMADLRGYGPDGPQQDGGRPWEPTDVTRWVRLAYPTGSPSTGTAPAAAAPAEVEAGPSREELLTQIQQLQQQLAEHAPAQG